MWLSPGVWYPDLYWVIRVCPCHQHVIDSHGDHIQHTGSTNDAHEMILDALQQICYESGLFTHRFDIPSVRKANGKTGRGDLLIKDANIAGDRHLVIEIACTHEFSGSHLRDVGRNGLLRDPDVNKLLETTEVSRGIGRSQEVSGGLKRSQEVSRGLGRSREVSGGLRRPQEELQPAIFSDERRSRGGAMLAAIRRQESWEH